MADLNTWTDRRRPISETTSALCCDGETRRFYADPGEPIRREQRGYISYNGEKVAGMIVPRPGSMNLWSFVQDGNRIPVSKQFQPSPNCSAVVYCKKTMRCVGGCMHGKR